MNESEQVNAETVTDPCPTCGKQIEWVEQYNRYYCRAEARYAPEGYTPKAHLPREIPEDLFDPIVGFDDIKEILRLSLASERPVHQFLWGPPASAKTLFMLELERMGDARYTLGSTTSRAGLRQLLMETQPRYLLVDELDKGRESDYAVLLSAMENGIMVDTHFDRHERVNLNMWVFAAGNSKDRIWPEILSRFGEGLRIAPYTPAEFLEVAERVLVMREGAPQDVAGTIAASTLQELRSRDVRDAIRVYRMARTLEHVPRIVEILRARR